MGVKRPWHRQKGETQKSWEAFTAYLAMPVPRSMARLATALGKKSGYVRGLYRWSAQHDWVARITAYDAQAGELVAEKTLDKRASFKTKFWTLTSNLLEKAEEAVGMLDPLDVRWGEIGGVMRTLKDILKDSEPTEAGDAGGKIIRIPSNGRHRCQSCGENK